MFTSIPSPDISYFDLGPVRVHFYALFILLGITLASWLGNHRLTKRGGEPGVVLDVVIWAVPLGILGGRFFHVVTHPRDYFYEGADLLAVFRIWEGGLAIYGALAFGAVGVFAATRKMGLRFWSVADALAPGILLAQAIGRLGNYFNQELFGRPTDLPWGLEIPASNPAYPSGLPDGLTFHPTFLYEMLWSLAGVLLILWIDRRFEMRWGKTFGLYLIVYSLGRIWIESIRIDPSEIILGLRINIWSALTGIAVGAIIIFVQTRRHPGREMSVYLSGREPDPELSEAPTAAQEKKI